MSNWTTIFMQNKVIIDEFFYFWNDIKYGFVNQNIFGKIMGSVTFSLESTNAKKRNKRPKQPKRHRIVDPIFADGDVLAPIHKRVLDRIDNLIKMKTPCLNKKSYRTKVALDHFGPWAYFTFKPKDAQNQQSINTTIPAGKFSCVLSNIMTMKSPKDAHLFLLSWDLIFVTFAYNQAWFY